jgi:hypothetical protein
MAHTTFDWSKYPEPLRSLAIEIAASLKQIAKGDHPPFKYEAEEPVRGEDKPR